MRLGMQLPPQGQSSSRLLQDFKIEGLLGAGAYGVVVKANNLLDKKVYAVKISSTEIGTAVREVENLVKIPPHLNKVNYYTCWADKFTDSELGQIKRKLGPRANDIKFGVPRGLREVSVLCIQMELCTEDLRDWLGRNKTLNKTLVTNIFLQISDGLEHIHKFNVIHRDLKPENIFLSSGGSAAKSPTVKIGDLGIATNHVTTNSENHTAKMGTPLYLAPEQGSHRYGKPADLYAIGLILYELVYPKLQPNCNNGSWDLLCQSFVELKYQQIVPSLVKQQWPAAAELILKLVCVNPRVRAGFVEIRRALQVQQSLIVDSSGKWPAAAPIFKHGHAAAAPCPALLKPSNEIPLIIREPSKANNAQATMVKPNKIARPDLKPANSIAHKIPAQNLAEKIKNDQVAPPKAVANTPPPSMTAQLKEEYRQLIAQIEMEMLQTVAAQIQDEQNKGKDGGLQNLCGRCRKLITGKWVKAMDKYFHPEHFNCFKCGSVLDTFFEKDGKSYCKDDYQKLFSSKCAECKELISDRILRAMGKTWHKEHFKCHHCHMRLEKTFFEHSGKPFCTDDHHALFSPKCESCKEPIKVSILNALGKCWHAEHFVCTDCKKPFGAKTAFFEFEGRPYCKTDFIKLKP